MIEGLLRWLARLLAGILERYSDPSLEAKLDAFHVRAAAADQAAKEAEAQALQSEAQYRESAARRQEWQARLDQSYQEAVALEQLVKESQGRIQNLKDDAAKLKTVVDARSDADVLRDKL